MQNKNDDRLQLRLPTELKKQVRIKAIELGYKGISEYIIEMMKNEINK